jgi:hypothetical protein
MENINYCDIYKKYIFYNETVNDIITVTALLDINRNSWGHLSRSIDTYLKSFKILLLMSKKMIIFIDERYVDKIADLCDSNKILIPINYDWVLNNCKSWSKIEKAKQIMNSHNFKNCVKQRIDEGDPSALYPEYITINHSKIDFIKYAIDNKLVKETSFICWCDFGYYNSILHFEPTEYPHSVIDLSRLNFNKLNFFLRNKLTTSDYDMLYTLIYAPENFTGSFFAGSSKNMLELYELYHSCLDELYNNNISDDDQHIYLRCFIKKPEIFELFLSANKWPQALLCLQHNFNNRDEFVRHYINNITNGVFAEIGVCHGSLSNYILSNNSTCKLYCIDPYISYEDYVDSCNDIVGDNLYYSTMNMLTSKYNGRVEFIRKKSTDSSNDVPNNLDFVYIDGNHKCKYVLEDLEQWYDKLKPGGFIICDDAVDTSTERNVEGDVFIRWNEYSSGMYGVICACKQFTERKQIPYFKCDTQILIFKPYSRQNQIQKKKLLYIQSTAHHKNNHAIMNYKRHFEITVIGNVVQLANIDVSTFDCVFSPCCPIDVSKYPKTKFIFGPQFSVFPDEKQIQLVNGQNSVYIQPSQWVLDLWYSYNLKNNMCFCPFGVDTSQFNQSKPIEQRNKVFIYHKRRRPEELHAVVKLLQKYNVQYEIFDYDHRYDENYYLNYLHESKFGIWVDAHESQGFALQEALACNVPLLVWNVTSMNQEYGSRYSNIPGTTIPYWDERCGEFFYNANELEEKFKSFVSKLDQYKPRDFIVENLSIEKCEDKLLEVINKINI